MVFLHGWGGSIQSFSGVAKILERYYTCVYIDLYGFGQSDIADAVTLNDYADGVNEVLEHLNIDKAILVGHSFGGRVALRLISNGYNARGLVLVDSAGLKPRKTLKYYYRRIIFKLKKALKLDISSCGSQDYKVLNDRMKKTFKAIVNEYQDNELSNINCDTLILWGKHDNQTPKYMAKRFKRNIKNSVLIYLFGGHFAYIQDSRFISIVKAFADGLAG